MKRILVALSLVVLAAPAFAVEISAPYEQSQVDRQLPSLQERSERAAPASTRTEGNVWANDYTVVAPAQ
jgi:hypothetical protein